MIAFIKPLKTGTIMQSINKQKGAASLLTAVMLIIATTLVVMSSGKTILQETKMTSNSYRTAQANAAASAAMDYATIYFTTNVYGVLKSDGVTIDDSIGGLDQWHAANGKEGSDGILDYPMDFNIPTINSCQHPSSSTKTITLGTSSTQQTLARFYFINTATYDDDNDNTTPEINNPCDANGKLSEPDNMNAAMVVAEGWSDDCSATRKLTQCVTVGNSEVSILKGSGPEQPFVTQGAAPLNGTTDIINRYTNITIWAGGEFGVDGSPNTFIRSDGDTVDSLMEDAETDGEDSLHYLNNEDEDQNTQTMSNAKNGTGLDIVPNDPFLANKSSDELFDLFFRDDLDEESGNAKEEIEGMAEDSSQRFTETTDLTGKSGLIWFDPAGGDISIGDAGTAEKPVIIIVEGSGKVTINSSDIFGVVYVMGTLKLGGNSIITGSIISEEVENNVAGTPKVIFNPFGSGGDDGLGGLGGSESSVNNTYTVVNGSWKDW